MVKKVDLEKMFNDNFNCYYAYDTEYEEPAITKTEFKKLCLNFGNQLLQLAAENALEVDYIERSMDKDVYSQILNTINQVE